MGQYKFFLKGLTKQADVPVDERSEIQEYNVARRLRGNQQAAVEEYIKYRGRERAQQDFCAGMVSKINVFILPCAVKFLMWQKKSFLAMKS